MSGADTRVGAGASTPDRAGIVLVALILVAAVANLNLSVANVALPDIGKAFDSSQVTLNLIAVGYSLGLAASVLYLGALGDRYGRKMMLILGTALAIPMSLLAAFAPSDEVLFAARVGGGLAAGMAYPTTLALITALWSGPGRTKSIALWSALGGGIAALGPLVSGAPGNDTACIVQALNEDFTVVGWKVIEVPASTLHIRSLTETVRVAQEANTGWIYHCWLASH